MKRIALALSALASVSCFVYARQRTVPQVNKASIEIAGVKLHLGMSKAEVAERFVGTNITKMTERSWIIGNSGTVRFKNEKLIFADRYWTRPGDDQIDAIFAFVSLLNKEGYVVCKVLSEARNTPITDAETGRVLSNNSSENVWIVCGEKTVLISKVTRGRKVIETVTQQLGEIELGSE